MEYTKPVIFTITPADESVKAESSLTWTPESGLKAEDDSFSSGIALFAVQRTADAQLIESGPEFDITPEGPNISTDSKLKDIYAAVYFVYKTFPEDQISVSGEAPTLEDMGVSNKSVDEDGKLIIN